MVNRPSREENRTDPRARSSSGGQSCGILDARDDPTASMNEKQHALPRRTRTTTTASTHQEHTPPLTSMHDQPVALRFRDLREPAGKPRGYARSYHVGERDRVRWCCDVTHDLWPGVRFTAPSSAAPDFSIVPGRRVMALSYRVLSGADGESIGRIARGLGARWKIEDASGDEVARLVNPVEWPKALLQQAFDSGVTRFAVVREDEPLGTVQRRQRPWEKEGTSVVQRWVRRHFSLFDWTLELEPTAQEAVDLRLLIAATLLLLELDIRAQAT